MGNQASNRGNWRSAWPPVVLLALLVAPGCLSDPDCGICDPDHLVLESVTGVNYANRPIHLLSPGIAQANYFVRPIGPCLESTDANDPTLATRGPEQWCKLSPLVSNIGLEFVFNNLLEPTTVELIRKDPADPSLFEVYDWKHRIAQIEGPITRFNGDYHSDVHGRGQVTRAVNLSCIDNLRAAGLEYDHTIAAADPTICEGFQTIDGQAWPLRMQFEGTSKSYSGQSDWREAGCESPSSGPDTCCDVCDYELSVNVAKYGVVSAGGPRRSPANAIACDPTGDLYTSCAGFVPFVERGDEVNRYRYAWDDTLGEHRLPRSDKLRETHPDLRPDELEPPGPACQRDSDCEQLLGTDTGAVCRGQVQGKSCEAGSPGCLDARCQAEWFVRCEADPAAQLGVCVDARHDKHNAAACYLARQDFTSCDEEGVCVGHQAGERLAHCDGGELGDECCQPELGGEPGCDPLFQPEVVPVPRFDRDIALPPETRGCFCGDAKGQHSGCERQIEQFCTPPWGALERSDGSSNAGDYLTRFVTRPGGVIYSPALKGISFRTGDRGLEPRALVERCATRRAGLIGEHSLRDGWRMHDKRTQLPETTENFDRALCSGSRYEIVFAAEGQVLRDKAGNRLEDDELRYAFETAQFQVVPGSGFPTDNLRIGACDAFSLSFSNKYDLDPRNLAKLRIVALDARDGVDDAGTPCPDSLAPSCWVEAQTIAGGPGCTLDPLEASSGAALPCLHVDVRDQHRGVLTVSLDEVRFGVLLEPEVEQDGSQHADGRYRLDVPGLEQVEQFSDLQLDDPGDLEAYSAAFHDVCGMPLITTGGQGYEDFHYDFTVDPNRCPGSSGDEDADGVQLSCDNAPLHTNPNQDDQDFDGIGDVIDLCPLAAGLPYNRDDLDHDGVGDTCDSCPLRASSYDLELPEDPTPRWQIRNAPNQRDTDLDGTGDLCDPCVVDPAPDCIDQDLGGPFSQPDAAGPVGFADDQDFDQDGLRNDIDTCPRVVVERQACTSDADCPAPGCASVEASNGLRYCLHPDADADGFGDTCDDCPYTSDPLQRDEDGDFIGDLCESGCEHSPAPRPRAFMAVSVGGACCTAIYPGDGSYIEDEDGRESCVGLCDPDGFPITADCAEENEAEPGVSVPGGLACRRLPATLATQPGILELPPGCDDALGTAGLLPWFGPDADSCDPLTHNCRLTLADVPEPTQLAAMACTLPQWDQDFDGIGDACDLCIFGFDPANEPYLDENTGKVWPNIGQFCTGTYADYSVCEDP